MEGPGSYSSKGMLSLLVSLTEDFGRCYLEPLDNGSAYEPVGRLRNPGIPTRIKLPGNKDLDVANGLVGRSSAGTFSSTLTCSTARSASAASVGLCLDPRDLVQGGVIHIGGGGCGGNVNGSSNSRDDVLRVLAGGTQSFIGGGTGVFIGSGSSRIGLNAIGVGAMIVGVTANGWTGVGLRIVGPPASSVGVGDGRRTGVGEGLPFLDVGYTEAGVTKGIPPGPNPV
jgi:hypothetical protein